MFRTLTPLNVATMSLNSLSTSSSSSGQGIKPARLRAACNPCHNAKIRCSGERGGCTRCRTLNQLHACKYSISRVGRASAKNKQGKPPGESEPIDEGSSSSSTSGIGDSSFNTLPNSGLEFDLDDVFSDQSINWAISDGGSPDFDFCDIGQGDTDSLQWQQSLQNQNSSLSLFSPLDLNLDVGSLGFDTQSAPFKSLSDGDKSNQKGLDDHRPSLEFEKTSRHQRLQQQHQRSPLPDPPASTSSNAPSKSDRFLSASPITNTRKSPKQSSNASQTILICVRLIAHLESQTNNHKLGLDGALRITKSCTGTLLQIANSEACHSSPNILFLLCVAVNQIIALFENQTSAMESIQNTLCDSTTLPSLLFGSFQIDPADQVAFCKRLVSREIQRCKQLLDRMSDMHRYYESQQEQQSCRNITFNSHSSAGLLHKHWFLTMTERLDGLTAAVAS